MSASDWSKPVTCRRDILLCQTGSRASLATCSQELSPLIALFCKQTLTVDQRMKRFACHSVEEIDEKRKKLHSQSTVKANDQSGRLLKEYLKEKGENERFEDFDEATLNGVLVRFYLDVRRTDGSLYSVNSLESIRHGLNRYLKSPPCNKNFDIIKDKQFAKANDSFRSAVAEFKRNGKGITNHHPAISENDLQTLYASTYMNPNTPVDLLKKVQFDIRLYFFRRGAENMHAMSKDTFEITYDSNGKKCVKKVVDELTKNHRENDKELVSAVMPENTGDPSCPVASFAKYLDKLHPSCPRLWQKPRDCFLDDDAIWYCNVPIWVNTLKKFMPSLSKSCNLSVVYRNHSIRATGATLLSRCQFGAAQIMAVTGHKSVSSLSVYQRVDDSEKERMGKAIQVKLSINQPALPSCSSTRPALMPASKNVQLSRPISQWAITLLSGGLHRNGDFHLRGVNLDDIFGNFYEINSATARPQMPLLYQCTINNLHIHYNK